jgi:hypothetical protein
MDHYERQVPSVYWDLELCVEVVDGIGLAVGRDVPPAARETSLILDQ